MIVREPLDAAVTDAVDATVAHVTKVHEAFGEMHRGNGRAHALARAIGLRAAQDLIVRVLDGDHQAARADAAVSLAVAQRREVVVRHELAELLDDRARRRLARDLAGRVSAHPVGDQEES